MKYCFPFLIIVFLNIACNQKKTSTEISKDSAAPVADTTRVLAESNFSDKMSFVVQRGHKELKGAVLNDSETLIASFGSEAVIVWDLISGRELVRIDQILYHEYRHCC